MALSLVSIYESTNSLATALDECLLVADDQLRADLSTIESDLKRAVQQEKASLIHHPPTSLIESELELISRLRALGDAAERVERETSTKLESWKEQVSHVEVKESQLAETDRLLRALRQLKEVRQREDILARPNAIEIKAEALLTIMAIAKEVEGERTAFEHWVVTVIDNHLPLVRKSLEDELSVVVKRCQWPISDVNGPVVSSMCRGLSTLARLQMSFSKLAIGQGRGEKIVANELVSDLWGLAIVFRSFILRFNYHFCTDRSTNRIDRPEWFVGFLVQSVRETAPLIETKLQSVLNVRVPMSNEDGESEVIYVDLLSQFSRLLIRQAHLKLESCITKLIDDDALLCHTMDELLAGDRTLFGEFGYGSASSLWPTLSGFFFRDEEMIEAWLSADLKFAKERLASILESKTSWQSLTQVLHLDSISLVAGDDLNNFVTECSDEVLAMVDSLGSRIELCKADDTREADIPSRFCEEIQAGLIREFALIASKRSDIGERLNTLHSIRESLLDWKLKRRYADLKRRRISTNRGLLLFSGGRELVKRVSAASQDSSQREGRRSEIEDNEDLIQSGFDLEQQDEWVFAPLLSEIDDLIQKCVREESGTLIQSVKSGFKEYEKKVWGAVILDDQHEVIAPSQEFRTVLSSIKASLRAWKTKVNLVVRAQLVSFSAVGIQAFMLNYLTKRSFTADHQCEQFDGDVRSMVGIFAGEVGPTASKMFERILAACSILTCPTEQARIIASNGDASVLGLDESLGIDFQAIARVRVH